jgi:hypothetical protein
MYNMEQIFKNRNYETGIIKCCKGKQKQCGGFTFKYITNENI